MIFREIDYFIKNYIVQKFSAAFLLLKAKKVSQKVKKPAHIYTYIYRLKKKSG